MKVSIKLVRPDSNGYFNGRYYNNIDYLATFGMRVYQISLNGDFAASVRAPDRSDAIAQARERFPSCYGSKR